ncbi:MAG: hypothetical protein CVU41_15465 [Chloroflexi bacterium HGW-Chloroflexi-3]|nr:MAG: hypothetical protein CVU41_15465 [Chloroflexi bacterium HGW-Chloroflexi-3]
MNLSTKIQEYIVEIESNTSKKVVIEEVSDVGLQGMTARYLPGEEIIKVQILKVKGGSELENSIAHEITHGYLDIAKGYCYSAPKKELSSIEKQTTSLIFTMIDDIVVNKIIFDRGFLPYSPRYIEEVEKEIRSFNKKIDHYAEFSDIGFRSKFIIFRFVLAWGLLSYLELPEYDKKILDLFLRRFKFNYPNEYAQSRIILNLIIENDIFTKQGHFIVINKIIDLWNFRDCVFLKNE